MKAQPVSVFKDADTSNEIQNVYQILNLISFGSTAGQRCENIDGYIVEITAAASGTDISASHDLGRTPSNWLQIWSNVSGTTYESSSGVSANSDNTAWFRATVAGNYRLIVI